MDFVKGGRYDENYLMFDPLLAWQSSMSPIIWHNPSVNRNLRENHFMAAAVHQAEHSESIPYNAAGVWKKGRE